MNEETDTVRIQRGGLYLSCALADRWFAGLESVILLRKERDLVILPVRHAAAGGYLLKRRNAAGDRLVFAPDFLRQNGLDENADQTLAVRWDETHAALIADGAFTAN